MEKSNMKKLILHVGAPKCGTSALQSVLEIKEKNGDLGKVGFTFPLDFSRGLGQGNSGPLFDDLCNPNSPNFDLSCSVSFLIEKNEGVIISDEKLFGIISTNKLNKLCSQIKSKFEDIIIVVAIRKPSDWLLSDYSQHIKQNVSNTSFSDHVVRREPSCNWVSYFSKFIGHGDNFRLVACDYKNLFNCIAEVLGVDRNFLSVDNEKVNLNPSLRPSQLEARRICNILDIKDAEKIKRLELIYQDFNLKEENRSLLKYIDKKNEGYVEKIKALKGVFFYEG
jgi:hypothetical protein